MARDLRPISEFANLTASAGMEDTMPLVSAREL